MRTFDRRIARANRITNHHANRNLTELAQIGETMEARERADQRQPREHPVPCQNPACRRPTMAVDAMCAEGQGCRTEGPSPWDQAAEQSRARLMMHKRAQRSAIRHLFRIRR